MKLSVRNAKEAHKAEIKSELELALTRMEENQQKMEQNQAQMLAKIAELKQVIETKNN